MSIWSEKVAADWAVLRLRRSHVVDLSTLRAAKAAQDAARIACEGYIKKGAKR